MKIDISDRTKNRFAFADTMNAEAFSDAEDISVAVGEKGIQIEGELRRLPNEQFQIQFDLTGEVSYPCSRCLEPVAMDASYSFEDVIDTSEDEIDLFPFVLDCLYIHEPTKVLCSEDCLGLCQHCGANLNTNPCSCEQDDFIDLRMEALQSLL